MTYLVDTERRKIFGPYGKDFSLVVNPVDGRIEIEVWHIPTANQIYVHDFEELTIEPDIDFSEDVWREYDASRTSHEQE